MRTRIETVGAMMEDGKKTVLVVDDLPENIVVVRSILVPEYRVKAATSGEAAFTAAREDPIPDLILLDVIMPGMSGFEACRKLKADGATKGIPVLFVTSRDDPSDESEGFAAGAVDYIHKPVNPHIVRARVKTHLELKASREDLERQNEILRENVRLREEVEAINRHDLKNPLMVVLWAPGMLLETKKFGGNEEKLLRMVLDAGRKMLDMINRTIDLYKMEKGTYSLQPQPVDALRVVRQIADANRDAAEAKNLTVEVRVGGKAAEDGDAFHVMAEEMLLYSMLANLVKNAVEASPPGGPVAVSLDRGGACTLSIHNRGCIPEGIRGRFMQKFATSGKERGTGLGAYSAKLIATTLGGSIDFSTSETDGTTITVRLPA